MLDAVNRLILDAFLENCDSEIVCPDELTALADKPSNETLHTVLNADGFDDFVQSLNRVCQQDKAGRIGQNSSILDSICRLRVEITAFPAFDKEK